MGTVDQETSMYAWLGSRLLSVSSPIIPDHPADVMFRVYGKTIENVFKYAALAMFGAIVVDRLEFLVVPTRTKAF